MSIIIIIQLTAWAVDFGQVVLRGSDTIVIG